MNILVSACLLGVNCRYNAVRAENEAVKALMERHTLIPVCPEQLGGLPTPRFPAERRGSGVFMDDGADVTASFAAGAAEALRIARLYGCEYAVLKERSPSCGSGAVYDGTFSGTLTAGWGVAAGLLREQGIRVLGESRLEELLRQDVR